jgi:hypothetical protein
MNLAINPAIAAGVLASTAVTDAAYVFFNAAVVSRRRLRAANWSAICVLFSKMFAGVDSVARHFCLLNDNP